MTIYRYSDGALANTALFIYLLSGYGLIGYGLSHIHPSDWGWVWFVLMVVLMSVALGHLMVLTAYLSHECMHNTVFKKPRYNDWLGQSLAWLLGAGYHPYSVLKDKHLRHHTERRDVLALDLRQFIATHPRLRRWVYAWQWWHFPAVELLSHGVGMIAPFLLPEQAHWRRRVLLVAASRLLFFVFLWWLSPLLVLAYVIAFLICISVLGFMDAYQHTYDVSLSLQEKRARPAVGRDYEETHTYSNLLSQRFPWLNLLVLNFAYHNVHHWRSGEPWYRLPRLHRQRYPQGCEQFISLRQQLGNYHRFRLARLAVEPDPDIPPRDLGAGGVSFLVGV